MTRRAFAIAGALLAAVGLTLGRPPAAQAEKAPEKSKVVVTYYYLPG